MTADDTGKRPTTAALRRCVLAVCVLDDIDLTPHDRNVVLEGPPPVRVPWGLVRRAIGGADPESPLARARLSQWFRAARWAAKRGRAGLAERARPYGMPVQHVYHPGLDWIRHRVLGDTLDLGIGFVGLDPACPDDVVPMPQDVLRLLFMDAEKWWPDSLAYLDQMGSMAARRQQTRPDEALRPMGDCDVVTLLASRVFRAAIAGNDPTGMRAVAVPMRSRGWLDLARIDPAFAAAAAAATDPADRGFDRPLLVTADEVVQPIDGGRPAEIVLRDPAAETQQRSMLYH